MQDTDRQVSKVNEQAIVLLQEGHVLEAKNLLQSARFRNTPTILSYSTIWVTRWSPLATTKGLCDHIPRRPACTRRSK